MDKLSYIVKTFSRTRRKDYENYVVNAIWQRLDDLDLKPVTQQCIRCSDDTYRFIDLYFPQIGIGVECDEYYHDDPVQKRRDASREMELIDAIRQIDDTHYRALHVEVAGKTLEEVNLSIDNCVSKIKAKTEELRRSGDFVCWKAMQDAEGALRGKEIIRVSDDIAFPTIADACNLVFGSGYKGIQRSFFRARGMRDPDGREIAWFPKLSLDGVTASNSHGWVNVILRDGTKIYQGRETAEKVEKIRENYRRVTFARMRDPITEEYAYRFVGVFEYAGNRPDERGIERQVFERVDDSYPLSANG